MNKKKMLATLILSLSAVLLTMAAPATTAYEAYYLYLGNSPSDANPPWDQEAQGLAHDQRNWFITQRNRLWRVPVGCDLYSFSCSDQGVSSKWLYRVDFVPPRIYTEMPKLHSVGYNHLGDPDYYYHKSNSRGYIVVPIEGVAPAIAIFEADTLQYINYARLTGQTHAAWCTVDEEGYVYSSSERLRSVNKYNVDWSSLLSTSEPLNLPNPTEIGLLDEQWAQVEINEMQGGELSPSDQLLYLVSASSGIHVFDLSTRKRIQKSKNGSGYFDYEFHPGGLTQEEPEGLTIWDLDALWDLNGVKAPCSNGGGCIEGRLRGQLHVLLLNNDKPDSDNVYMKHYTGTIYVDRAYGGVEKGTPSMPFNTVGEANNFYPVWDGAQIKIRAGIYPETLTFSKRVKVLAEGGSAIIGR